MVAATRTITQIKQRVLENSSHMTPGPPLVRDQWFWGFDFFFIFLGISFKQFFLRFKKGRENSFCNSVSSTRATSSVNSHIERHIERGIQKNLNKQNSKECLVTPFFFNSFHDFIIFHWVKPAELRA